MFDIRHVLLISLDFGSISCTFPPLLMSEAACPFLIDLPEFVICRAESNKSHRFESLVAAKLRLRWQVAGGLLPKPEKIRFRQKK